MVAVKSQAVAVLSLPTNSFYDYTEDTYKYFNGLGFNVEEIIEASAKPYRKKLCKDCVPQVIGEITDIVTAEILKKVGKRKINDVRELADFTLAASLITTYYVLNGEKNASLSDYILSETLKEMH